MTFQIVGCYDGMEEELDTADTKREAERLAREYLMAFRDGWAIWVQAAPASSASSMK